VFNELAHQPKPDRRKTMATNKAPAMDLSNAFGDLTKMFEQFKLPGVDTAETLAARRKDVEALVQANQAAYEGMQALASKQADMLKQAMEDIQAAVKGAAGSVGDPAKQGELARKAYEKVLSDMQDLAGIARKSQSDAMVSITQRGTQHLEEVKKMMNPK
jgi:phasin family protein